MNRETLDIWCKRCILLLVSVVLLFTPLALGGVRPSEFIVVQWLTVAIVLVWLIRLWVAPKYRFLLPPTIWSALLFVAYAVWRYRTADIEYLARQELMLVLLAVVLLIAIVDNLHGQSELRILVIALITLATFIAMYGIYQWLTGSQQVWHFVRPGYEGRGSGTYICPNHFAGFLEMICPIAIMLTVFRGFGAVPRILLGYASLVMLVGIAASGSRGGWLSTGVAVMVLVIVLIRRKGHVWAALAVLLTVGGTGTWLYARALKPRVDRHAETPAADDLRVRLWVVAGQMWRDHPWFGVGPNHFDSRYRRYRPVHWQFQPRPDRAHNDYVNTLADWGLLGFVLVLVPVAMTGFGAVRTWRYLQRRGETAGTRAAIVLGSSIGILSLLVHSFFDFNMHIPANALLATTLVAFITLHWRFASQRFWLTARWPVRIFASLLLAAVGYYLGMEAWRHTLEIRAIQKADAASPASTERIAALKEAFEHEPKNAETAFQLGEQFRMQSWRGDPGYESTALEALNWFRRAAELNPWDPHARIRAGMCLDWIERPAEAEPYFVKALELDPNHAHTTAMMGWHYFQSDRLAESCTWLEKALQLNGLNETANTYLPVVKKALSEKTNASPSKPHLPIR